MMEVYLMANILACNDGYWIIEGIEKSENLTQSLKSELIVSVRESMPDNCDRKDYTDSRN